MEQSRNRRFRAAPARRGAPPHALWRGVSASASVDVRRGDAADPLRGVVRFSRPDEPDVDVIIGRPERQQDVLTRASLRTGHDVPVASPAELILLKLYAGGSQDAWEIDQLLMTDASGAAGLEVEQRLGLLPADSQRLWERIRAGHS
jgi:hypothetical protein